MRKVAPTPLPSNSSSSLPVSGPLSPSSPSHCACAAHYPAPLSPDR